MGKLKIGINGNQLKLIAAFAMVCDHVGRQILTQYDFLIIIGRISFPIFAYMIAEGCRYTKSRVKYLGLISGLAIGCQAIFYIAIGALYQNTLITFSLSLITVFCLENFLQKKNFISGIIAIAELAAVLFICLILPEIVKQGFTIDYGIAGVLLPVIVYFMPEKWGKIAAVAAVIITVSIIWKDNQWYALFSLPFLCFYNGERGKFNLKYFFYIFYPAHLAIIYLISMII